jgi:beta-carotene 15,15'-dioxygenase
MGILNLNIRIQILIFGVLSTLIFYLFKSDTTSQIAIFAIAIALTGIPHGALDLYLDRQQQLLNGIVVSRNKFLFSYLLKIIFYGILWYVFPIFAFFIFIAISSKHFGEIDCAFIPKKWKPYSVIYGLFIISFIVITHFHETAEIISYFIPNFEPSDSFIYLGMLLFKILGASIFITSAVSIGIFRNSNLRNDELLLFLAQTMVLLFIVYFLPFYLSFAFYFGLWHSMLSFDIILQKLQIKSDWSGWKNLILKALPFSLLAWIGLGIVMIWGTNNFEIPSLISWLFVGIATLTLPHLQIFSKAVE